MLVVLAHAGVSFLEGGYIGVDVFFVISGYLITSIILKEQADGRFSFVEFYKRRARRIIPALLVVLASTLVAGYFILLPSDYSFLSLSALSSIFFSANIFFWNNSQGYFAEDADQLQLMHIWSLSVEEQFYFIWPALLLLVLKKFEHRRLLIGLALMVASFCAAQLAIRYEGSGAYFLIYSRAGELLIGAVLAMLHPAVARQSARLSGWLAVTGVFLILGSALALKKTSAFPGVNAIWPCLGAALVIASAWFGQSLVGRVLASKVFVFIGLISYSIYLWHWPMLSYLRYLRVDINFAVGLAVVIVTIALAYLTYRLIETPLRRPGAYQGFGRVGYPIVLTCLVGALIGVYGMAGIPSRFPYSVLSQDDLMKERDRYWVNAKLLGEAEISGERKIMIVGNSHAIDLHYALTENGVAANTRLVRTTNRCFDFGYVPITDAFIDHCKDRFAEVIEQAKAYAPDAIYLHDDWSNLDINRLEVALKLIRSASSAPIYVLGPKNVFKESALNLSRLAWENRMTTPHQINNFAQGFVFDRKFSYDDQLKSFFAKGLDIAHVYYISVADAQCGHPRRCNIVSEETGEYLYFDREHLTVRGAKELGTNLKKQNAELF